MKKFFYVALVAIAAVAFTSCKPGEDKPGGGDDPQAKVTITVQPKTLLMAPEDQERVRAVISPAGTELTLSWRSTNPAVATVTSSGMVTAVDLGSALVIVSAEGIEPDTCEVTVSDIAELKAFDILDYSVFGRAPLDTIEGSDVVMHPSFLPEREEGYHCLVTTWMAIAWDGNVAYTTKWVGEGFIIYSEVPFYTIADEAAGDYNGMPFGVGTFQLKQNATGKERGIGLAGNIPDKDQFAEYLESYLIELQKEEPTGADIKWDLYNAKGATVWYVDATDPDDIYWSGDNGLIYALVKDFEIAWNAQNQTFTYSADIDWLDVVAEDRWMGLLLDEKSSDPVVAVKPYDLAFIPLHYSNAEENEIASNDEFFLLKRVKDDFKRPTHSFKAIDKLYRK